MSAYRLEDLPPQIAARITVDPVSGCWIYDGGEGVKGYMKLRHPAAGERRVHRAVYALLAGPIPPGLTLDHVKDRGCVSRACCWPAHLEPVTRGVNVQRAGHGAETHCVNGHEFSEVNTYRTASGKRQCMACKRIQQRKRRRAS
jgi:hypothetical protein